MEVSRLASRHNETVPPHRIIPAKAPARKTEFHYKLAAEDSRLLSTRALEKNGDTVLRRFLKPFRGLSSSSTSDHSCKEKTRNSHAHFLAAGGVFVSGTF